MAQKGVGNTALGAAICRLIEQYEPVDTRLFNDPVVKDLVGTPIRLILQLPSMRKYTMKQTDAIMPGIYGAQICRTRYIDDVAQNAQSQGIGQMVILGAGLDTRPYRLSRMDHLKVIEVDLPSAQNEKKKRLQGCLGRLPEYVTFIPIDFDTQTLEEVFANTAFDLSMPAIFIWEGVTQYLSEETVRQTLSFIGKSAPGSILVFTYVLKDIIERRSNVPGAEKMMERVAKNNAPWIFGLDPSTISSFLKPHHLSLIADIGDRYYQEKYLRPIDRNLFVSEAERIANTTVE
jgi:methyltransferase (TIGR00027 family)